MSPLHRRPIPLAHQGWHYFVISILVTAAIFSLIGSFLIQIPSKTRLQKVRLNRSNLTTNTQQKVIVRILQNISLTWHRDGPSSAARPT